MKRLPLIVLLAGMLAAPAWADYDAAGEAREAAQRKAEQQEAARKKAEVERMKANAQTKYQREALGPAAKGKSDAEVARLYNQKMGDINRQAAEATRGTGKAGSSRQADADTAARNTTGKSMAELQNMSNEEAQALAREMQKKYGNK